MIRTNMIEMLKARKVEFDYRDFIEMQVKIGNDTAYYNIEVDDKPIDTILEDMWWSYKVPLTDVDFNIQEDFDYFADEKDNDCVLGYMKRLWNENRDIFIGRDEDGWTMVEKYFLDKYYRNSINKKGLDRNKSKE